MKKLVIALFMVCIVLAAVACASPSSALDQNKWSLVSYGAEDSPAQILPGTEITWLLKSLNFKIIDIYGCGIGDFNRNNPLTSDSLEMLVIAQK